MPSKRVYNKPFKTVSEQVDLLEKRGLVIPDREQAERWLRFVNYYRLSAYTLALEKRGPSNREAARTHCFRDGASFEDAIRLHTFDSRLRRLCWEAIESIEIAVRTVLCHEIARSHGSHWFEKPEVFSHGIDHMGFVSEIRGLMDGHGRHETFVRHYRRSYRTPDLPPSWMLIELMSFGFVSRTYRDLNPKEAKRVAAAFGLPAPVFGSWLHMLSYLRNLCAHHGRVWNRVFVFTPTLPKRWGVKPPEDKCRFALYDAVIEDLLRRIHSEIPWRSRMDTLTREYAPVVQPIPMGYETPEWKALTKRQHATS